MTPVVNGAIEKAIEQVVHRHGRRVVSRATISGEKRARVTANYYTEIPYYITRRSDYAFVSRHSAKNLCTIRCVYVSFGESTHDSNFGWLTQSGKCCVSRQKPCRVTQAPGAHTHARTHARRRLVGQTLLHGAHDEGVRKLSTNATSALTWCFSYVAPPLPDTALRKLPV